MESSASDQNVSLKGRVWEIIKFSITKSGTNWYYVSLDMVQQEVMFNLSLSVDHAVQQK